MLSHEYEQAKAINDRLVQSWEGASKEQFAANADQVLFRFRLFIIKMERMKDILKETALPEMNRELNRCEGFADALSSYNVMEPSENHSPFGTLYLDDSFIAEIEGSSADIGYERTPREQTLWNQAIDCMGGGLKFTSLNLNWQDQEFRRYAGEQSDYILQFCESFHHYHQNIDRLEDRLSSEFEEIAEIQTGDITGRSYEQLTEQDWSKELIRLRLLVGKSSVWEIDAEGTRRYPETGQLNELAYQTARQRLICEDGTLNEEELKKLTSRLLRQISPGECIALGEAAAKETGRTLSGVSVEDWFQEKLKYGRGVYGPENFSGDFQWLDGDGRVRVTMGTGDYEVSRIYESGEMGTWLNDEGKLMVDISLLWKDFGLVLDPPVDYNPTRDTIELTAILSAAFIFSDLFAVGASRMIPKVTKLLASPLSIGTGEIGLSAGGTASVLGGVSALTVGEVLEAVTAAAGVGALSAVLSMAKVGNGGGEGEADSKVSQESDMHKQSNEQLQKSKESYEKLIEEHQQKLDDYIKDPYAHDNKGVLENAPNQEIRDKIIQGRIDALQKQINKQQGELEKIIDLLRERGISN